AAESEGLVIFWIPVEPSSYKQYEIVIFRPLIPHQTRLYLHCRRQNAMKPWWQSHPSWRKGWESVSLRSIEVAVKSLRANNPLQPTASSIRSCVAPASGSG